MPKIIPPARGMHDILPHQIADWTALERTAAETFAAYGYGQLRTPVLEREELFVRPVGKDTDIVRKELFRTERGADGEDGALCLRPEATVAVVRALGAAGLLRGTSQRVWYLGPMFRRERPQKGRSREFHQFGAEALGDDSPLVDAEIILIGQRIWRQLGIAQQVRLQVNNLGLPAERVAYRAKLQQFLRRHQDKLGKLDRERVETNPLRVLDSNDEAVAGLLSDAPLLRAELGAASRKHYDQVLEQLGACGVSFVENPRLVRGLDYYNLTVFEWEDTAHQGRQNAIAGGGRYDGLLAAIGGGECPGVGMAAGMERILGMCDSADAQPCADIFMAATEEGAPVQALLGLAERFRDAGFSVLMHPRTGKIRKILKHAYASPANYAIIIGARELASGEAAVEPLRSGQASFSVPIQDPISIFRQQTDEQNQAPQ